MTTRRIIRNRRLTAEESAKYKEIREQVAEEFPELIARHHERSCGPRSIGRIAQTIESRERRAGAEPVRSDSI